MSSQIAPSQGDAYKCQKCQKVMSGNQFYTYKNGEKVELCKKCLTMHVDCFNPDTFLWLMEKLDVPYIEEEWNVLRDREYLVRKTKMSGSAVFGKYIAKMHLRKWKDYRWADTQRLIDEKKAHEEMLQKAQESFEKEVKEQYERGDISEFQFRTLTSTITQDKLDREMLHNNLIGDDNPYDETKFIKEDELPDPSKNLTEDDKLYLAMKWGRLYRPNEWIELEKKYQEMTSCFEINDADTTSALILICKTYLKMNQAIDSGDTDNYQKLSRVYDSLRKSSNFTAIQNKEEKEDFLGTVGELVAYCEKEGGKIPKFDLSIDRDIVDKVIIDLKEYNKSLIYEDTSLARQIEDYLKKRQAAEKRKEDQVAARERGGEFELSDEDIHEYNQMIEQQKEEDLKITSGD